MQQLHVKKGGSTDLEINIKDMLKNVSKEKEVLCMKSVWVRLLS